MLIFGIGVSYQTQVRLGGADSDSTLIQICKKYQDDFGYRHKLLVDRLLSQDYKVNEEIRSKRFMGGVQI